MDTRTMSFIACLMLLVVALVIVFDVAKNGKNINFSINEYQLEDGTRCAYLIGYRKGGLSCDW